MYYIGLKPTECLPLTRDCIDLQNNQLDIKSQIGSSLSGAKTIKQTKTPDSMKNSNCSKTC